MIDLRHTVLAAALLGALGCSDAAGGPDFAQLGVRAVDESGQSTGTGCTTLPVLLGSRVLTRYDIGGRFDVIVDADWESARVRLEGVSNADDYARTFSEATLRSGVVEQLEVPTSSGMVTVTLRSGCES